jgi:hypothetical protein
MHWIKSNQFLSFTVLGLVAIALVIHFTLFDGIHIGEAKGTIKKVYVQTYSGWKVGGSSLYKAKLELETGEIVSVVCEITCKYGSTIKAQVYEPIFSSKRIYIYKTVYPF